jgi:hypothetical protein
MVKRKNELVTREASLAGRAMERLTVAAAEALKASDKANGDGRTFQMVASEGDVTALIKAPGITMQFRNGTFAVDVSGGE